MAGVTFPRCPETFFSGRSEQERDRHQKLHRIQQGDIFAVPLGTVYWFYNHGDQDLILLTVFDLNNKFNQLDNSLRVLIIINFHFFLISIYSEFIKSMLFIIANLLFFFFWLYIIIVLPIGGKLSRVIIRPTVWSRTGREEAKAKEHN